eukprot:TRINITY_DN17529_c0_g1_i1.p1 TRINITY_DN17529_c0_g1~~TRINITY_DN17529_c0_g1_i1.p1  ORF type:complete len:261 (-),score=46.23 TRINITY_DN17529_c0_g1_i1:59-793(-)
MLGRWAMAWRPGAPPPNPLRLRFAAIASALWVVYLLLKTFLGGPEACVTGAGLEIFGCVTAGYPRIAAHLLHAAVVWRRMADEVNDAAKNVMRVLKWSLMSGQGFSDEAFAVNSVADAVLKLSLALLHPLVAIIGVLLVLLVPLMIVAWTLLTRHRPHLDVSLAPVLRRLDPILDPLDVRLFRPLIRTAGAIVGGSEELLEDDHAETSACLRMKRLLLGLLIVLVILSALVVSLLCIVVFPTMR